MKVCVHIGPHKTGTTAVQSYLLRRYGSVEPQGPVWYPVFSRKPSHVNIADWFTGERRDPERLVRLIRRARRADVDRLLLSAEDFVSLIRHKALGDFGAAFRGLDTTLITTQNAFASRIPSQWREHVKHGEVQDLSAMVPAMAKRPLFSEHFYEKYAAALDASRVVVVCVARSDPPERLFEYALQAFGLPFDPEDDFTSGVEPNKSLTHFETEILRALNREFRAAAPDEEPRSRRLRRMSAALREAFRTPDWAENVPRHRVEPPAEALELARLAADRFEAQVDRLRQTREVVVLGNLADLRDGLEAAATAAGNSPGRSA